MADIEGAVLIVGTIRMAPDSLDAARPAMAAMIAASRAEPGCLAYSYAEDVLEPGLIRVNERWSGREALSAHFKAPHIAAWRSAWATLGITDRNLWLYEVASSEPC
ncbi:MAG: putative quinol monooxygenase [Sphingomonas sp.]